MGRLEGKVALVTGAAHGMGASHAISLAKEGADVALADIWQDIPNVEYALGTEEELNRVVEEIRGLGRRAIGIRCDVSKSTDVERMVQRVIEEFGRIDILVNNAGVAAVATPLWETTEEQWDTIIDVNLKGTFLCCKYVLPHMISQQSGKVINVGSIWGREGGAGAGPYCASKGGVHNLTHSLAKDCAQYNINVNAVGPGAVLTPMFHATTGYLASKMGISKEELYPRVYSTLSIFGREVLPQDVSNAVVFLASEESRNINGMVIYVDGGHLAT